MTWTTSIFVLPPLIFPSHFSPSLQNGQTTFLPFPNGAPAPSSLVSTSTSRWTSLHRSIGRCTPSWPCYCVSVCLFVCSFKMHNILQHVAATCMYIALMEFCDLVLISPSLSYLPLFLHPSSPPLPPLQSSPLLSSLLPIFLAPCFLIDLWILLTVNIIVAIVGAITADAITRGQALVTMGVSILYWVLFVPGSFCCWFLPAYHAFK